MGHIYITIQPEGRKPNQFSLVTTPFIRIVGSRVSYIMLRPFWFAVVSTTSVCIGKFSRAQKHAHPW